MKTFSLLLVVLAALHISALAACQFPIEEATVAELRNALDGGFLTSVELVQFYLNRIAAHNDKGASLHAVIETNPDALLLAAAADAERVKCHTTYGCTIPQMHGIPILLKDNIASADKMQTTAGSWVLYGSIVPRDSFVVSRLRKAGAILLGKANLSEWANFRGTVPNGWSGRGGQTINPYGGEVCGSSSGSAVAATANFAAVTLGSETDGSIACPSSLNGVVGLKPTIGLVSRAGVIPISHTQDSVGPMVRTVADAAVLMDVIAGTDSRDPATALADSMKPTNSYTSFLVSGPGSLKGKRIGLDANMTDAASLASKAVFESLGATVVDIVFPNVDNNTEITVLFNDFKYDIAVYLSELANCPHKNLADLIAATNSDPREGSWGTSLWDEIQANYTGSMSDPVYLDALKWQLSGARENGVDALFKEHKLDAVVGKPNDLEGTYLDMGHTAALAGYPVMSVPAPGNGTYPSFIGLIGLAWSEPTLLSIAYAYEQATHGRIKPVLA
ncbi:amidase signature domain-containing protein [Obelidium mucronatum]|nr:amidase signature domain-containing protein [Obelidium mucronatum]